MKMTNIKPIKPNFERQNIQSPKVLIKSKEYHFVPDNLKIASEHRKYNMTKHIGFPKSNKITINVKGMDLENFLNNKNNRANIIEKFFSKFKKKKNKRKIKHSNSSKIKSKHSRRPPHKPPKK